MSSDQRRENSGAAWQVRGFNGKVDIQGSMFYLLMVQTGARADSNAPAYKVIIRNPDNTEVIVPVWKEKESRPGQDGRPGRVAYFKHGDAWVSIYRYTGSNTERPPYLTFSVKVEQQGQAQGQGQPGGQQQSQRQGDPMVDDDVPF